SESLAGEIQRLAVHAQSSAVIRTIRDKDDSVLHYEVVVYSDSESEIKAEDCGYEHYSGSVYCVTLAENHVLYVRRQGKGVWCGNSGRHGNKGVIAKIYPDHEMPTDEKGEPFDMLLNSQGLISRGNASQIIETLLGRAAKIKGQPYKLK